MRIKQLLIFLLLLSITFSAVAAQETLIADSSKIIFEAYGKKGLKDKNGKILLAAKYEALSWEKNPNQIVLPVRPFKKNGYWGILDANLQEVTAAKFIALVPFDESTLIAAIRGKYSQTIFYGLVNFEGKVKLAFNYRNLIAANDLLIAASKDKASIYYGLLDDKGKMLTPSQYYQINYLGEGYFELTDTAGVTSIVSRDNLNEPVINQIDSASVFSNNLSIIYQAGKVGMLHKNGRLVLPIMYKKIERNDGKLMTVTSFKRWKLADASGQCTQELYADSIHFIDRNRLVFTQNGLSFLGKKNVNGHDLSLGGKYLDTWGKYFLVKSGKHTVIVDSTTAMPLFRIGEFIASNDFFLIGKSREFSGNAYTVLNTEGDKRIVTSFELNKCLLTVELNGYWGMYNEHFKELIPPIYDEILPTNTSEFIVKFQGDYGVIDKQLNWLIGPEMLSIEAIDAETYWTVNKRLVEKLIQKDTTIVADLHFLNKEDLLFETNNEGYIRLISNGGYPMMPYVKGSLFDSNGKGFLVRYNRQFKYYDSIGAQVFTAFDYDSIGLLQADFLPVKRGDTYGFIDFNGKLRVANRYQGIYPFSEGLAAVNINGKWGFINREEMLSIQPYYEHVASFVNGKSIVVRNGKYGLIDNLGDIIIDIEYDWMVQEEGYYLFKKGLKWGYANQKGNIIHYPSYNTISILNGLCLVERYNQFELLNGLGENVLKERFDGIYWDKDLDIYTFYNQGIKEITFLSDLKAGLLP